MPRVAEGAFRHALRQTGLGGRSRLPSSGGPWGDHGFVSEGWEMARWKPLPSELDPAVVEFVGQLRRLKDQSGWSLQRLSASTGYSASSWERYLGGRLLPPWEAVRK